MHVLINALLFGLGLATGVMIVIAYLIVRTTHFADRLMFDLPWLKWFTLEEACATGCPLFYCQVLLPAFYIKGYLEIRERNCLSDAEKLRITEGVLDTDALELYEFRLTKRKNRKRRTVHDEPNLAWRPTSGLPA